MAEGENASISPRTSSELCSCGCRIHLAQDEHSSISGAKSLCQMDGQQIGNWRGGMFGSFGHTGLTSRIYGLPTITGTTVHLYRYGAESQPDAT